MSRREPRKPERKERTYKADLPKSVPLDAGNEVEGVFQNAKSTTITDKRTKEEKEVMVYTFRDAKGVRFAVLGRFNLDMAFEEVFEREGGMEKCQGLNMRITRGDDSKLSGGRTMGNYEISVWEE